MERLVYTATRATVGVLSYEHEDQCERKRVDAIRYHGHRMVYDAGEQQGLRDSVAAREALRRVYAYDPHKSPYLQVKIGNQIVCLWSNARARVTG